MHKVQFLELFLYQYKKPIFVHLKIEKVKRISMSEDKKVNKKVAQIILQLSSPEPKDVIKAVKALKMSGNETAIEPLIDLYCSSKNNAVKAEIVDLLNSIKSTKVPPVVIDCLVNEKYASARQVVLSSIWNSNLDYTDYLLEIAEVTQKGEMMDAMEFLTILENMEGTLSEEKIMDALLSMKSYLVEHTNENSPKMELLKEATLLLTEINNTL